MSDNPLSGKVALDTTNYKAGVADLNRQVRVIESGFKAVAASMGDWDKSSAGLEARIKALTGQIGLQQQKVDGLSRVYQELAADGKTSKKELDLLQISINKETETLNKMQGELRQSGAALEAMGKESKGAGDQTQALQKHEDKARTSTDHLGNALKGLVGHAKSAATGLGSLVVHVAKLTAGLALGLVGAATAAGVAIGALAAKTIGPASDLNETVSKVGVVFGDASGRVLAFGKDSATSLGMSENAALAAAGTYGNLFRSMGMTDDKSADMSVGIVKLAGDLASFNNLSPEEVLEKLRAGLTGETEPLKALGVNISAAALKTQALKMGFKEVNGELPAAAKAQASYALIMEQTALAQGDFARTSGGLANQQRILASQVENLKAKIGTALLPIVTRATTLLNNFLESSTMTKGVEWLTTKIGEFGGKMDEVFTKLQTGNIRGALNSIFGRDNVDKAIQLKDSVAGIADKIGSLANTLKTGGISGLFKELFSGAGSGDMASGIGEMIGNLLTNLATKPERLLQTGLSIINGLASSLVTAIPALLPVVLQLINAFIQFVITSLPMIMQTGLQLVLALVNGILPQLPMLIETALQLIITLATGIAAALPQLIPTILEIIPKIILTLLENLPALIQAALQLILALATGLIAAIPILLPYIPQIVTAIFTAIIAALPMIGEAAVQLVTMLITGIVGMLPTLGTEAGKLVTAIADGVKGLVTTLWDVGKNIVDGVWQGIQNNAAAFGENIQKFFTGIVDGVKKALGIASPSKVFAGIGQNMALGLGAGFTNSFKKIATDVNGAIGALGNVNISGSLSGSPGRLAQASVGGDTINQHFYDQGTAALGLAMVDERRRARLNATMGA
ncbi:MAG: hypothetical protein PHQ40_00360 [Anaerolineaceae bacterium]|nr:hypothetical protein [Anaerolineaceae bacterium]MDD5367508.1 hypothetical protein [Anaerolineaceae bacterium]